MDMGELSYHAVFKLDGSEGKFEGYTDNKVRKGSCTFEGGVWKCKVSKGPQLQPIFFFKETETTSIVFQFVSHVYSRDVRNIFEKFKHMRKIVTAKFL